NLSGSGNGHDRIGMVSEGTVTGTGNLAASQGLPLELDATLHVGAGGSLNLLAGAMLYMGGTSIYVEPAANGAPAGVFNASGTQPQPVTLTSAKASPSPGDWGAVVFQSGSSGTLDHVQLSYAGARTAYTFVNGGSTSAGIIVNGAQPTITHSVLDRIYGYDVIAVGGGLPILHNDRFGLTLSGFNGVQNSGWQPGQPPIDATNNDWGAADGPSGIGLGSGVAVSQGVYYDPWISSSIATLSGTVFGISSAPQNVLPGAAVQVCRSNRTSCRTVMTDANGVYSLSVMPPGQYLLEVNPPAGKTLISQPAKATVTTPGQTVTQDIILSALTPPPPGSTRGEIGFTSDGYPVFVMGHPIIICFPTCPPAPGPVQANPAFQTVVPSAYVGGKGGCEGGTAEIPILKFADGKELYHVGVPEDQANKGFYKTDLGNVADHGGAAGDGVIHCPDGSTYTYPFGLYNDPSGTVKDTQGRPVIGATVTLLHSDSPTGSYIPVPDGSAIMSPSNRRNPDITNNDGLFHWDVLAGFYKVQASKTGCPNTGFASYNGADPLYQGGAVLPVPPPVVDLVITLDCPSNTPGPNVTAVLPFTGPSRGGTTITLSGSNFQSGATVTIGGQPATGVSVSPDGTRVTFTTPAIGVIGDVNGDGHVDAVDALCVLRDVAGLAETAACPASALNKSVAVNVSNPDGRTATPNGSFIFNTEDFNGDLKVDAVDALCILRSVAGLTPTQACPSLSGTGQAAAVGPQPLALPSSRSR
ncbi:MAG: carboxypeptidase regulatory-like domain-containing protein, partial [Dehalococcoidia bacterium]